MKFPSLTKLARAITGRNPQARYDAAGTGRRMRGWNPPKSGPNLAMAGVELLRARARDAAEDPAAGNGTVSGRCRCGRSGQEGSPVA